MNWITTKNNFPISRKDIPELSMKQLRKEILDLYSDNRRIAGFFGKTVKKGVRLYVIMADDEQSLFYISSALFKDEKSYPAITPDVPAFHMFEREFWEEFGIVPEGHPWLKPVRYAYNRFDEKQTIANYPFFKMDGEEIHEVAVGPVHAGVIEPGHFRFMCDGETVNHLEIQLGYQHRGIEPMLLDYDIYRAAPLIETVAGDTVVGHASAYAHALESLTGSKISLRAKAIRGIGLELERVAMHTGDLGALCNDVAYLLGSNIFGAIRTTLINTSMALCGNRFGKGLICPGGVLFDIDSELKSLIKSNLLKSGNEIDLISEAIFGNNVIVSRFEKTGVVEHQSAQSLGMIGLAARASGVKVDARADHPYGIYNYFPIYKRALETGDVFSRAFLRYLEIQQSINFMIDILDHFPEESELRAPVGKVMEDAFVISMIEGFRGAIAHCIITDKKGDVSRYKIKDPSFNNWFGLAMAVRNNGISDFPLCNKSFNLSYCGVDL